MRGEREGEREREREREREEREREEMGPARISFITEAKAILEPRLAQYSAAMHAVSWVPSGKF